jgi:hypothetical protein
MHLIETYALSCGLKIDKPYVFEHFTSIPFDRFITFNKKGYPYYLEVIELIQPELSKRGIQILQLKASAETKEAEAAVFDNLIFGQWAYLMKHSLLHFGEDEFLFDIAGYYDIPRVILYSNTYPSNFKPYWGSEEKQRILFNTGPHSKPTFDANASFIHHIKPEDVAQNIIDLLHIDWKPPYKTIYAGPQYRPQHDIIEIIPDKSQPVELFGRVGSIGVRMDYNHDEQFLANVLERSKAAVICNKPVNMGLLQMMRTKITEIAYVVDINSDIQFARELGKLNLPYALLAYKQSNELKEKFFEVGIITNVITATIEDVKELKNGVKGLYYKSAKRVVHGKIEYKGEHQMVNKLPSKPDELSPCPEDVPEEWLREVSFFFAVKPTN